MEARFGHKDRNVTNLLNLSGTSVDEVFQTVCILEERLHAHHAFFERCEQESMVETVETSSFSVKKPTMLSKRASYTGILLNLGFKLLT